MSIEGTANIGKRCRYLSLLFLAIYAISLHFENVDIKDEACGKYKLHIIENNKPVENYASGLDFSILNVNFVAAEHHGYIFTHSNEISMPVGYVLVSNSGSYIKHNYSALPLNIVPA